MPGDSGGHIIYYKALLEKILPVYLRERVCGRFLKRIRHVKVFFTKQNENVC